MTGIKKFRTSFSGYDKKDVYEYLENLSKEVERQLKSKDLEIDSLKKELAGYKEELSNLPDGGPVYSPELELQLENKTMEIASLKRQLSEYREELANRPQTSGFKIELENELKTKAFEIDSLKREIITYKEELANRPDLSHDYSREKTAIADTLIKAEENAKRILDDAKNYADMVKLEIEHDFTDERRKLQEARSEVKAFKNRIVQMLSKFNDETDELTN